MQLIVNFSVVSLLLLLWVQSRLGSAQEQPLLNQLTLPLPVQNFSMKMMAQGSWYVHEIYSRDAEDEYISMEVEGHHESLCETYELQYFNNTYNYKINYGSVNNTDDGHHFNDTLTAFPGELQSVWLLLLNDFILYGYVVVTHVDYDNYCIQYHSGLLIHHEMVLVLTRRPTPNDAEMKHLENMVESLGFLKSDGVKIDNSECSKLLKS